ncbi:hypothetical protein [Paenibacillus polysaccharolyticus]|uniref:hypothetical protein n=1 Tax=Paenibacillus polysaccharolyticus TaxID=582692 RepID=UPI0030081981
MTIKDYVTRRRDFAKTRADQCKTALGPTPNKTHNYFGGHSLGYWEGRAAALDDILGVLEDDQYEQIMVLEAEIERLRKALTTVMHVSKWDGISHELDRCYSTARDALEEVTADATR